MSREEFAGPAAPAGNTGRHAVDADVLRPPWHKPQMWLLDYTETEASNLGNGESESTGYGPTS